MYPIEPVFVIFPALCLLLSLVKRKQGKATFAFIFIVFFLLYILSLNGSDIVGYSDIYRLVSSPKTFNETHSEIGFKLLMLIFARLRISYIAFRICLLTVNIFVLFYTLYKISPNFSLSVFFLTTMFVIYTISTYRQFMVMSFSFLIFYQYSKKSGPMSFIALALLALIHISSLILLAFLIVYDFLNKQKLAEQTSKLSKNVLIWMAVALVFRYAFILIMRIGAIKSIMSVLTRGYSNEPIAILPFGLLARIAFLLGVSIMYRIRRPQDRLTVMLYTFYFVGMVLYIAVPFEGLMGRLMNNFYILGIALIPMLCRYERVVGVKDGSLLAPGDRTWLRLIVAVLIFIAAVVLINQLLNQNGYWPYLNLLFGDKFN